jgi:hypothetical protein
MGSVSISGAARMGGRKSGGDDDAAEVGSHAGERGLGLGGAPRLP